MWDERYGVEEYVYGTEPNEFLRQHASELKLGRVLCLGEGEGRNAVWLAQQGHAVTAVDASQVGLEKARRLAAARGVAIETVHADLADYVLQPQQWDLVVSIFCHLPPPLRSRVHAATVAALRPAGRFLLEGYTPQQLTLGTGGPRSEELMMTLPLLTAELQGLRFDYARELQREVVEGSLHHGLGAVVQLVAVRD